MKSSITDYMKNINLLIILCLAVPTIGNALKTDVNHPTSDYDLEEIFSPLSENDLIQLSRKEVELKLGRKLSFREMNIIRTLKIRKKFHRSITKDDDECNIIKKKSNTALIFSSIGCVLFPFIFSVIGIILGLQAINLANKEPTCDNALITIKKGAIAVALGIFALFLLSLIVILSIL